jgi:hypothetical protein
MEPHKERGLHWRAVVLQYAKWPYVLLGLVDVVLNRKVPYALTRKVSHGKRSWYLLAPHGLIAGLLLGCWAWGASRGREAIWEVKAWAVLIVAAAAGLVLHELLTKFPPPFEKRLWEEEVQRDHKAAERTAARDRARSTPREAAPRPSAPPQRQPLRPSALARQAR